MPRKPTRDIICAECPDIYSEYDITASRGEESRPLVEVLGPTKPEVKAAAPVATRRALGRLFGKDAMAGSRVADGRDFSLAAAQRERLQHLGRLKEWTFTCPKGHTVDGNRGYQIPLAVVGASGSSKSHFLPGLIWETSLMRVLSPLGVTLRTGQFTSNRLSFSVRELYEEKKVLPPTPPTEVAGPFGYRLSIREHYEDSGERGEDVRYSLLLFDVGGEALSSIARIGEQAAFVLLAQSLIVLIDPMHVVSTRFDESDGGVVDRERVIAAAKVRDSITLVADALEEMWDGSMKQIPIPACFVVAKADSLGWTFDWKAETAKVVETARKSGDLTGALQASSDRVREAFDQFGGGLIIDEIEDRFATSRIRFAAASATCEMPIDRRWEDPNPAGIALSLLHVLEMLGKFGASADEATRSSSTDQPAEPPEPTASADRA